MAAADPLEQESSPQLLPGAEEVCARLEDISSEIGDRIMAVIIGALNDGNPEAIEAAKSEEKCWARAQRSIAKAMAALGHRPPG